MWSGPIALLSEVAGGLFFALGLFTPVAAVLIVLAILVGIVKVTGKNGYWITAERYEYSIAIIAVAGRVYENVIPYGVYGPRAPVDARASSEPCLGRRRSRTRLSSAIPNGEDPG